MWRANPWFSALSFCSLSIAAFGWAQSPSNSAAQQTSHREGAVLLETLTWDEAERVLTPDALVVIPLGAESKEHGRHLQLNNDFLMAEYFKRRVLTAAPKGVIVAPTINYNFYQHGNHYAQAARPGRRRTRERQYRLALHRSD